MPVPCGDVLPVAHPFQCYLPSGQERTRGVTLVGQS